MTAQTDTPRATPPRRGAMAIVRRYCAVSAGAGLITVPFLDVSALAGVHVALIRSLTEYYGEAFSEHAAKNILMAIGASLVPGAIGSLMQRRVLAWLPFVSPAAGLAGMAATSAAVSYGLGLIFIRHFEAGGTLEDFDVRRLHHLFKRHEAGSWA